MELAREAYEAYRRHTGGKSLATGQPIPAFEQLPDGIIKAWEVSTAWVVGLLTAQGVHKDRLFVENERLKEAIWPGLPKWEPTEATPQQDFYEAVAEALREEPKRLEALLAVVGTVLVRAKSALMTVSVNAPGYDWNADPMFLTRTIGEASAAIDAMAANLPTPVDTTRLPIAYKATA